MGTQNPQRRSAHAIDGHMTNRERILIFGGVPSIVLEPTYPEAEFEAYLRGVFRTIAPGDAFILGVADNVMPTSIIERVERIADLVEQDGTYPIQAD